KNNSVASLRPPGQFHWNRWPESRGLTGRFRLEWVAGFSGIRILVVIGVTEQGRKEFIAIEDGFRESEQSWSELLLRVKAQGL
ncbi:transposase, partial [Desulfogranum marinum]|uniref:transposase n=1 Tax=Desulfogranum marinum TaxID=453220 RepID=UPI00196502A0